MSNHQAIIARVAATLPIPGADNIHVAVVLGENVIVSKNVGIGYVGVLFPAEVQLSEEYCRANNLYRHAHLNADPNKTGFFDDNRRVRVQPFMKIKSTAYFTSVESLAFTGEKYLRELQALPVGVSFDLVGGKKICEKYISKATREAIAKAGNKKQPKKAEVPFFHKHQDTSQFKHNMGLIPKGALLSFQSKKHGTSQRSGITKVYRDLPKWKKIVNRFVLVFPEWTWQHCVGTRNVVLSDGSREGWHGSEAFRFEIAEQIRPFLENGMLAYYEIVGFVNGKSIMPTHDMKTLKNKEYTKKYGNTITYRYGCKDYECKFHIYRLTQLTEDGKTIDFSQAQLEKWCDDRSLPRTVEVAPSEIYDGDVVKLAAKVDALTERHDILTEDATDPTHISEGIIIRIDAGSMNPNFQKSKSYAFRVLESICEAVDTEDLEAA